MLKRFIRWILGPKPEIFNSQGQVEHPLPPEVWDAWKKKYLLSDHYNWRQHSGFSSQSVKSTSQSSEV